MKVTRGSWELALTHVMQASFINTTGSEQPSSTDPLHIHLDYYTHNPDDPSELVQRPEDRARLMLSLLAIEVSCRSPSLALVVEVLYKLITTDPEWIRSPTEMAFGQRWESAMTQVLSSQVGLFIVISGPSSLDYEPRSTASQRFMSVVDDSLQQSELNASIVVLGNISISGFQVFASSDFLRPETYKPPSPRLLYNSRWRDDVRAFIASEAQPDLGRAADEDSWSLSSPHDSSHAQIQRTSPPGQGDWSSKGRQDTARRFWSSERATRRYSIEATTGLSSSESSSLELTQLGADGVGVEDELIAGNTVLEPPVQVQTDVEGDLFMRNEPMPDGEIYCCWRLEKQGDD
jgi:hypothetical protein